MSLTPLPLGVNYQLEECKSRSRGSERHAGTAGRLAVPRPHFFGGGMEAACCNPMRLPAAERDTHPRWLEPWAKPRPERPVVWARRAPTITTTPALPEVLARPRSRR